MALSFIGSGSGSNTTTSTASYAFSSLRNSSNVAPTLAQNDIVIINVVQNFTATRTLAQLTPTGYTAAHASVVTSTDTDVTSMAVFYKFMGATPDTTVTIPASAGTTGAIAYSIQVWRGADTTTPWAGVTPTTATGINGALADPPSITTPGSPSGCVVFGAGGNGSLVAGALANAGATPYDSTTNIFPSVVGTGSSSTAASALGAKTGLAISTAFNGTMSGANSTATSSWGAIALVLAPFVSISTVTTSTTQSVAENSTLSVSLTADGSSTPTWSITGGADSTKFNISGTTLRWTGNCTRNFERPQDADANNVYVVQVTGTDALGGTASATINVTVTDASDALGATAATYTTTEFSGTSTTQTIGGTFSSWFVPFTNRSTTSGRLLVAIVSTTSGNAPTLNATEGWTSKSTGTAGASIGGAVFTKVATGSDTLSINTSLGCNVAVTLFEMANVTAASVVATEANSSLGSANSDPPANTFNTSGTNLVIAVHMGSSGIPATAPPTGYADFTTNIPATTYTPISWAAKVASGTSEDPGTFTSASTNWITFTISVATKDIVLLSSGTQVNSTGDGSVPMTFTFSGMTPAPSLQAGDLVVVNYVASSTTDLAAVAGTTLIPSGYTAAHTDLYSNVTFDTNMQVSYKFMGGTPDTTVTLPGCTSSGDGWAATIFIFRNVDNTTGPIDVTPTTATDGGAGGSNADAPAITPSTPGAWIMACGGGAQGNAGTNYSNTPTGMTDGLRVMGTSGTRNAVSAIALNKAWVSGAYDPGAWTGGSTANNTSWAAVTLALTPGPYVAPAAGMGNISVFWF